MVQIIRAREKGPSRGEQLAGGFSRLAQGTVEHLGKLQDQKSEEARMKQENEAIKNEFGIDISSYGPEMRQKAFALAMQSRQNQQEYGQKLAGQSQLQQQKYELDRANKEGLLEKKLGFLGKTLGGENNQGQPLQEMQQDAQEGGLDVSKLTDADIAAISAIDPNMARSLNHAKDVKLREQREQKKFEESQRRTSPEYVREQELTKDQAKADTAYNTKLQDSTKRTVLKRESLNRLKQLNKKGATGKPFDKLLEKAGLIGLTSDGRREFAAEVKNQFTDFKDIAGSQLTGQEFQTLSNAYPSPDFSKEANEAIISNLEIVQDTLNEEHKIANRIKKAYGKIPPDFQGKVNEQLEQYVHSRSEEMKNNLKMIRNEELGIPKGYTLMIAPDGEDLQVKEEEIPYYESLGALLP